MVELTAIDQAMLTGDQAAIVMLEPDEIVALGAVVAEELYGTALPVVVVDHELFGSLRSGEQIFVRGNTITRADGTT